MTHRDTTRDTIRLDDRAATIALDVLGALHERTTDDGALRDEISHVRHALWQEMAEERRLRYAVRLESWFGRGNILEGSGPGTDPADIEWNERTHD